MATLRQLIKLHNLPEVEGETSLDLVIRQLSELEEVDLKTKTVQQINSLIDKYKDLFGITAKQAKASKNSFTIDDKPYYLPTTFLNLQYGQWEDIQSIINRKDFGNSNLEKLPYILATIFDSKYEVDSNHQDIMNDSIKYLDMNATEALAVWNFFISEDKAFTIISGYYSDIEVSQRKMEEMKRNLIYSKMKLLKTMTINGVHTLSDVILLKNIL